MHEKRKTNKKGRTRDAGVIGRSNDGLSIKLLENGIVVCLFVCLLCVCCSIFVRDQTSLVQILSRRFSTAFPFEWLQNKSTFVKACLFKPVFKFNFLVVVMRNAHISNLR